MIFVSIFIFQYFQEPGENSSVQTPEDRLQGLRRSLEPQGRQGEDRSRFPDRGTEDRDESPQGPGQERLRCLLDTERLNKHLELNGFLLLLFG